MNLHYEMLRFDDNCFINYTFMGFEGKARLGWSSPINLHACLFAYHLGNQRIGRREGESSFVLARVKREHG